MSSQVPAAELNKWQQHSVYFGSTVVSVCRGMTTRQVAAFFDRGILCVRAYYPSTGAPVSPVLSLLLCSHILSYYDTSCTEALHDLPLHGCHTKCLCYTIPHLAMV